MEKIGNLITRRLNQHKLGDSARASEAVYKANQYLGQWLRCDPGDVRAYQLKQGTLWIRTRNAAWGQETWAVTKPLLKKLQGMGVRKIRTKSMSGSE